MWSLLNMNDPFILICTFGVGVAPGVIMQSSLSQGSTSFTSSFSGRWENNWWPRMLAVRNWAGRKCFMELSNPVHVNQFNVLLIWILLLVWTLEVMLENILSCQSMYSMFFGKYAFDVIVCLLFCHSSYSSIHCM